MQACNWPQKRPIAPFIICRIFSLRLLSLASKRGCERIGFSLVSRVTRPAHPLSFTHSLALRKESTGKDLTIAAFLSGAPALHTAV